MQTILDVLQGSRLVFIEQLDERLFHLLIRGSQFLGGVVYLLQIGLVLLICCDHFFELLIQHHNIVNEKALDLFRIVLYLLFVQPFGAEVDVFSYYAGVPVGHLVAVRNIVVDHFENVLWKVLLIRDQLGFEQLLRLLDV